MKTPGNDSSGFYFDQLPGGETLGRFGSLDTGGIVHGVTTLKGFDTIQAAKSPGDAAMSLARTLSLNDAAWLNQVHADQSIIVDSPGLAGDADGLISDTPGLVLVGRSADCPLVLVSDPEHQAVGMFHSGWRGTVGGMPTAFIRRFVGHFDSDPSGLLACICPSVGACCYEVGQDVQDAALSKLGAHSARFFAYRQGKLRFDMQACIRDQLLRVGLTKHNVHISGVCTICHEDLFCSYRKLGEVSGRFQAAIARGV